MTVQRAAQISSNVTTQVAVYQQQTTSVTAKIIAEIHLMNQKTAVSDISLYLSVVLVTIGLHKHVQIISCNATYS